MEQAERQPLRLFYAANLRLDVTQEIAGALDALRAKVGDDTNIGWVRPANLHITLAFIGWQQAEMLDPLGELLQKVASASPKHQLRASGLGCFPTWEEPKVLWAGIHEADTLVQIAAKLRAGLIDMGVTQDERDFHPHITLGRIKSGGAELKRDAAEWIDKSFGESQIDEIVLYESRLQSAGAEYTALRRYELA